MNVDIVPPKDHCVRLWNLITHEMDEIYPKHAVNTYGERVRWGTISQQLLFAASIQSMQVDSDIQNSSWMCRGAAEWEDKYSEFLNLYLHKVTMFMWIWGSFEATVDLVCEPKRTASYRRAIDYIKLHPITHELTGISRVVEKALKLLRFLEPELHTRILNNVDKENEQHYMPLHICSILRNQLLHGKWAPSEFLETCPNCNRNVSLENEPRIQLLDELNRLCLLCIQTLLYLFFANNKSTLCYYLEFDDLPLNIGLQILHSEEPELLLKQLVTPEEYAQLCENG